MQKKLWLLKEIERRNDARIRAFTSRPRKTPSQRLRPKPMGNRPGTRKPKG